MGYLRLFRINLGPVDKGFCLILDNLEKNYRQSRDARGELWRNWDSECGLRDQGSRMLSNSVCRLLKTISEARRLGATKPAKPFQSCWDSGCS